MTHILVIHINFIKVQIKLGRLCHLLSSIKSNAKLHACWQRLRNWYSCNITQLSLHRQHSDAETDEEAAKTVICGPLTSNQVVLLNVVHMYVLCWTKWKVFSEKVMLLVTYFSYCFSRSWTQKIFVIFNYMFSFYASILYFIEIFFGKK